MPYGFQYVTTSAAMDTTNADRAQNSDLWAAVADLSAASADVSAALSALAASIASARAFRLAIQSLATRRFISPKFGSIIFSSSASRLCSPTHFSTSTALLRAVVSLKVPMEYLCAVVKKESYHDV